MLRPFNLINLPLILLIAFPALSQEKADTIQSKINLLTQRAIDRPLNLYKGQLQVNADYRYSLNFKDYGDNWEPINVNERGSATVMHSYFFNINYGITDYLQFITKMNYSTTYTRYQDQYFYYADNTVLYASYLLENYGFYDLFLGLSLKLINKKNSTNDLIIFAGISVPTATYLADKPANEVDYSSDIAELHYHDFSRNGYGVCSFNGGFGYKYHSNSIGFRLTADYYSTFGSSENIDWLHTFDGNNFYYTASYYNYKVPQTIHAIGYFDFQANKWFEIFLGYENISQTGGWTELTGQRVDNKFTTINYLEPGFEIQVTNHLRWIQVVNIPLFGKSTPSYFSFQTGISINYFPFK